MTTPNPISRAAIQELFEVVKTQTLELAKQIAHDHEYKTPFEIKYKNLLGTENEQYDLIIQPGSPVTIIFNDQYILSCLLGLRSPEYFKKRVHQALFRMYKMHRTLSHLIPLHTAIAWKKEAKTYTRIPNPEFLENQILNSKSLEISYSVTVLHTETGTSVVMNGLDPIELEKEAIHRLSQIIFSNDELMDMLDQIHSMKSFKPEYKESSIAIGGRDGEVRERKEY